MQDNARYVTAGTSIKPDAGGTYSLGPNTTIEFNNNSGIDLQRVRLSSPVPAYANMIVSGSNVGTIATGTGPNSFIQFQPNGTFRVTESGTFKISNSFGFSGDNNTAIANVNNPTITLDNGSTVEYAGAAQTISLFNPEYKNVTISGTGIKTLKTPVDILVGENLNVNASTLLVRTDEAITVDETVNVASAGNFTIENSGSLVQVNETSTNSGKISMARSASVKNLDYVYWSSPITGFNVDNISATNRIYTWDPVATNANNTQGDWVEAVGDIMEAGIGYIVRAPSGQAAPSTPGALNFTATFNVPSGAGGVPHNGSMSVPISRGSNAISDNDIDDNWNLIGNPYPSAISADAFLTQNTSIEGSVNIWKHGLGLTSTVAPFYQNFTLSYHQSDYFYYNLGGASDGPVAFTGNIAAGQSFMVSMIDGALPATSSVVFNNTMRSKNYSNNQFFRNSDITTTSVNEEHHRIWLDLITPSNPTNRILVGYMEGATQERDRLYDAVLSLDAATDGIYTLIDEEWYIIQGRSLPFNDTDVIPLGLKVTQNENYTIAIAAVDGLFETNNQTIYLKDNAFGSVHNLTEQPYSFNSNAGVFNDRFEIVFTNRALAVLENDILPSGLTIIELNDGRVKFNIGNNLEITSVEIIDMLGRTLYQLKGDSSSEVFELSNLSQAAYIAKVTLSNGQMITKRAVKRK